MLKSGDVKELHRGLDHLDSVFAPYRRKRPPRESTGELLTVNGAIAGRIRALERALVLEIVETSVPYVVNCFVEE